MKYMLMIYNDEVADCTATKEQMEQLFFFFFSFTDDIKKRGIYVAGDPLQPVSTATTLRQAANSTPLTTDGPYAETKEQLGGYYIVDCPNLDEALACAKQICAIHTFSGVAVEVRPVMDVSAMMNG